MVAPLNRIDLLFRHNARTLRKRTHLILPDASEQSYGASYERAGRIASAIAAAGISRGARVMVLMGNSREMVEMYIACSLAGVVCVPVNILTTARELIDTAADCTPSAAFIQRQLLDRVTPEFLRHDLRLKVVIQGAAEGWEQYDALLQAHSALAQAVSADPEEAGVMIYSSGTTGRPKGILLRQRGIMENAHMTNLVLRYQANDITMTMLPLFSSFGFCWDFLMPAQAGARTLILPKFDPLAAIEHIERHCVTVLAGVPTMYARLFDAQNIKGRDFSSLRLLDVGGGPVSDRLKLDLKNVHKIEIVESYGLSEISPVASLQVPFDEHKVGACGQPLPGIEVKVLGPDDEELPPNTAGEFCFRCSTFMIGYWNKPEQSAQALRGGWLHSGDIGIVDEDGELFVRDRLKDIIISSGYNIYPKEVENALCEHKAVQSAAAIGVPDEIRGELVHAFVVLKPGAQAAAQDLIAHCAAIIGKHKLPRDISFVSELPLTASGKIQRFALRELLAKSARAAT
ncbi:MAG: class I adenylate-forming enzyme family protein [Burkholderiales bacterium]